MTTKNLQTLKMLAVSAQRRGVSTASPEEIQAAIAAVDIQLELTQIEDFKRHVIDSSKLVEKNAEDFYDLKWSIEFNGQKVAISNNAVVYNAVDALLQEVIDEY